MAFKTVIGALLGLAVALIAAFVVLSYTTTGWFATGALSAAAVILLVVLYQIRSRCC